MQKPASEVEKELENRMGFTRSEEYSNMWMRYGLPQPMMIAEIERIDSQKTKVTFYNYPLNPLSGNTTSKAHFAQSFNELTQTVGSAAMPPKSFWFVNSLSLISSAAGYYYASHNNPFTSVWSRWLGTAYFLLMDIVIYGELAMNSTQIRPGGDLFLTAIGVKIFGLAASNFVVFEFNSNARNRYGASRDHIANTKVDSISIFKFTKILSEKRRKKKFKNSADII